MPQASRLSSPPSAAAVAPLVGRAAECGQLESLLDRARRGESGVLVLRGEPGIGKTALLDYAVEHAEGMGVVRARGLESESELPFAALAEILGPLLRHVDDLPAPQRAALASALALGPPILADPFAVGAATLGLLAAAAEDAPLLAVVDDAQWLDAASGQALLFAARRLEREGVALLVAVRGDLASPFDDAGFSEIGLTGLDEQASLELLARGTRRVAPEVATAVLRTARGNPLALLEIPTLLTKAELEGREALVEPLPLGVALERAFTRQVEALAEDVRLALVVAAASEAGTRDVIARAIEALGGNAAALEHAEAAGVISLGDELRFRHPLLRSAAYHRSPPATRRAAHHALANSLPGDAERHRRAWHLALAASGPDADVADALADAGTEARERMGLAAAASAFERAARLTPAPTLRVRRLADAARDWLLAGQIEHASSLVAAALPHARDRHLRVEIDELHARCEFFRGRFMTAHALLLEAAAKIEDVDSGRAAVLTAEAARAPLALGDPRLAIETAERASALADRAGGEAKVVADLALVEALMLSGETKRAEAILDRWLPALRGAGDLADPQQLAGGPALTLLFLERYSEARSILARLIEAARQASALSVLPVAVLAAGVLDYRTGNWSAARASASEGVRLAQDTGQVIPMFYALASLARLDGAQGLADDCRAHAAAAAELGQGPMATASLHWVAPPLALLALAHGDYDEAIERLEPVARNAAETGLENPAFTQWPPDLIEAYARSGRTAEAESALVRLEHQGERTGLAWVRAAAARCRGLLAANDDFEREFEEAVRWHDRTPTPFERARTELCLGERRRRARRRADARGPLRSALAAFERLGAMPWADRARSELRASGERTGARIVPALELLTAQELQVAEVVAAGATNREAAAALFLSAKTIEFHLHNIYGKLGIRTRADLARVVASVADARSAA